MYNKSFLWFVSVGKDILVNQKWLERDKPFKVPISANNLILKIYGIRDSVVCDSNSSLEAISCISWKYLFDGVICSVVTIHETSI